MAELWKLKALGVGTALETTFSTAVGAGWSSYSRVPAEEIVFTPDQEFVPRPVQRNTLVTHPGVVGGKGGTVTFKTEAAMGLATAATNTVAAVAHAWLSALLKGAGLAETLGTGTTTTAAAHTTTSVTGTTVTGIAVGTFVGIVNGSDLELAMVTAKSGSVLTLAPALGAAPGTGATIFSSASYAQTEADPGTVTLIGVYDGGEYAFTGCKGAAPKLTGVTARGRPMFEWSFSVDSWSTTTRTGTIPTLPTTVGQLAMGNRFYWGSSRVVHEVSFDPGATVAGKLSVAGADGRAGWITTDRKPGGSFKPYFATAFRTDYDAETARALFAQIGKASAGGSSFGLYAHLSQIVKYPGEVDVNGNVGHEVVLEALDTTDATLTNPWQFGFV